VIFLQIALPLAVCACILFVLVVDENDL